MRVRLKADGRLVEIMADGSERAIAAGVRVDGASRKPGRLCTARACGHPPDASGFRRAARRSG